MGINTTCRPDPREWHDWFAWRPIYWRWRQSGRICTKRAWLVTIQRRAEWQGIWDGYGWVYREKPE